MDAKTDYPAACNAVEKVLVHESLFGPQLYKLQVCTLLLHVHWLARQRSVRACVSQHEPF